MVSLSDQERSFAPKGCSYAIVGPALALLLSACGSDAPPGGARLDGSSPVDLAAFADVGFRNPRPDGGPILPGSDREVELAYGAAPVEVEFQVDAAPSLLDVHLSVDTTGSFDGEIDAIQRDLETRIVPEIAARVPEVAFGVSRFEDFPVDPFGNATDSPFALLTPVTTDIGSVRSAVNQLDQPLGQGGDGPESGLEAIYQALTGQGIGEFVPAYAGDGLGGAGFREGALHAILHITDAPTHIPSDYTPLVVGAHGESDVRTALRALPAFLLAAVGSQSAREDLEPLVAWSGAAVPPTEGMCPTGLRGAERPPTDGQCPLVFDIAADGSGLSGTLIDAIGDLLDALRYASVTASFEGDPLGFIASFRADSATVPAGSPSPDRVDRDPVDGIPETFVNVVSGATLRFVLTLRNDVLPEQDYPQAFRVRARIMGDGIVLHDDTLRIVVPARAPEPIDAGLDGGSMDGGPPPDAATPDGGAP